jgi:DNA polymerase-1
MGLVLLLDAVSFLLRAHAVTLRRPLSTKEGVPIAATLLFVKRLRAMLEQHQPEHRLAIFRASRWLPPELAVQLPYIGRALEALRIPSLDRVDAEHAIGTLARQASSRGHPVVIVSSNKIMLQLVGGGITVLHPLKGTVIARPEDVVQVVGVTPAHVPDAMALRGDPHDRIPGAPGIGPKGAMELVQRWGSVETLLEHAAEVERRSYRESLLEHRARILDSKRAATIDTRAPIELDLQSMKAEPPDREAFLRLLVELDFESLLPDIVGPLGVAYEGVDLEGVLDRARESNPLAVALDGDRAALSTQPGVAVVVPLDRVAAVLDDPAIPKAVHDHQSALHRRPIAGVRHDPMLYSYLLDPTLAEHGLYDLALRRLAVKHDGSAAEAADLTGRFAVELSREVEAQGLTQVYQEIDLPLAPVLAALEETGIAVDVDVLRQLSRRLEREIESTARALRQQAGEIDLDSRQEVASLLFDRMRLPKPQRYGRIRAHSTRADVLEHLAPESEVARRLLDYRHLTKLKSAYTDKLPLFVDRTGRLHARFDPTRATTGRLAASEPNLQSIPVKSELGREIRSAFVAQPGHLLLAAHYLDSELRLLAHFSEDQALMEACRRRDIHASELARILDYSIPYGISKLGLARRLGISRPAAQRLIDRWFAEHPGVSRFIERTLEVARRERRVRTLFGRIRPTQDIDSLNVTLAGRAERTAVNTQLQGSAADLVKLAMIRIDAHIRERELSARLVLQVHDELIYEVPRHELDLVRSLVRTEMEQVHPLRIALPVETSFGPNWRDLA